MRWTCRSPPVGFAGSIAQLALNFMPDPARAVLEMRRVTRAGGVVAAAVWDFCGGLVFQRLFWDTAAAIDPQAARPVIACLPTRWRSRTAWSALAGDRSAGDRARPLTIRMDYAELRRLLGAAGWRPGPPVTAAGPAEP